MATCGCADFRCIGRHVGHAQLAWIGRVMIDFVDDGLSDLTREQAFRTLSGDGFEDSGVLRVL